MLLVWNQFTFPYGRSIVLKRQPRADAGGYPRLEDEVDIHWLKLFGAAALSSIVGVGSEFDIAATKAPSSTCSGAAAVK